MNKLLDSILDWNLKMTDIIIGILLSSGVIYTAQYFVEYLFVYGQKWNLFGLSSLSSQISFCTHSILIKVFIVFMCSWFVHAFFKKSKIAKSTRVVFWSYLLFVMVIGVTLHYYNLSLMYELDPIVFQSIKYSICY